MSNPTSNAVRLVSSPCLDPELFERVLDQFREGLITETEAVWRLIDQIDKETAAAFAAKHDVEEGGGGGGPISGWREILSFEAGFP